ncbi:4-galactosyl-N-acetylglucosaminide 3-alpha-L-fucosyltransferase FUT6-like isoform X2 [Clavelina lepadiformis]|uniref:4-galactosyl-N-acetylglucosaminide 3-alpha-L-fucosyltransferase FUT6-like isoform X2 n=1 Tax=Clavelina lepadiformis TaxID=159417 RepID=UPI004042ECE7
MFIQRLITCFLNTKKICSISFFIGLCGVTVLYLGFLTQFSKNYKKTTESVTVLQHVFRGIKEKNDYYQKRKNFNITRQFMRLKAKAADIDKEITTFRTGTIPIQTTRAPIVLISDVPIILLWNNPFNDFSMVLEFLQESIDIEKYRKDINIDTHLCGKCRITLDRNQLQKSDAVVFHLPQLDKDDLPPRTTRRNDQLYVWWAQESSASSQAHLRRLDYFNLTMTVRRSSDVYSPYATLDWVLKLIWLAVWVVSNCGNTPSSSLRFAYADKLQDGGLQIDKFGRCSGYNFPIRSRYDPAYFEVLSRYKFYFAFENSYHCKDYATEKLWLNALYSGAIPVIFGPDRRDIEAVLPSKTFIHAEDFQSPSSLVRYLLYLDKNATAYAEYHEWRTWVRYFDEKGELSPKKTNKDLEALSVGQQALVKKYAMTKAAGFCALCKRVTDTPANNSVFIHDVGQWWRNDNEECLNTEIAWRMLEL